MKLPLLVKGANDRLVYFFIGAVSTIILYQWTNRTHLLEPSVLQFTSVDQAMPFVPWTIWIYFTEYLIFIVSWIGLESDNNRTKYFYSYMAILILSTLVFLVWPTTFPRHAFPLEITSGDFTSLAFNYFRANMDTPANCVPSLHVSSCYIAAFVFWDESKPKFAFFFFWATLVAISTMTTKQHYFLDVWTAFLLVLACYFYFFRVAKYGTGN